MKKLISGAINIEVKLQQGVNRIFFPDNSVLRGKRIKHISVYKAQNDHAAFVTLKELNTQTELIKSLPIKLLHFSDHALFINKIVDLPHSYIDISQITEAQKVGSYTFIFWYDEPAIWSKIPEKNNRTEIHPIEIKLSGPKTYFAENRDLHNKKFQNLIFSMPNFTPMGNETTSYLNCFLTLCKDNLEFIQRVPLEYFVQGGNDYQLRLQNITFDFQRSYIETTAPGDYGKSIFFNAIIDDNKKK
ncbi:MAG: hypothetical protein GX102_15395 [Porphyromonadaceae bacterium]|nr:hypothetical protein [Porphyromonadaceae bacterium]